MWRVPMLPKIDPLPGTQCAGAVPDGNIEIGLRQDAANVRGHVVRPFGDMDVFRITVRNGAKHEGLEISAHIRVGVFAEYQRCAGVPDEKVAKTCRKARIPDETLHLPGNVVGPATAGFDSLLKLPYHDSAGTAGGR